MSETSAKRARSSTVIATRVNWLGNRLVTTASATYGQIGLGFLDARLLLLLGRRPDITAARIAEILGVDAAAVSRAVKSLKARRLIAEARGPLRSLSLTDDGKAIWHQIEKISDEREVRLLRGFSEDEAEQVLNYLSRMLDNMADVALLAEQVQEIIGGRAPEPVG
ncbi:MAG TPA: MarR family winged helix-turn-helix transcriptional regulator [Opitutaceae bacterium]|nr:MarR family winged helix-turn-helix transcriptional regulator [Opitutaceae bacterium]